MNYSKYLRDKALSTYKEDTSSTNELPIMVTNGIFAGGDGSPVYQSYRIRDEDPTMNRPLLCNMLTHILEASYV